jgi:predicted metal-dependent peptidase
VAKRVIQHRVTTSGHDISSDLLAWAEKSLKAKSDWRTLLRSAIARAVVYVQGSYELSRRRLSRRSEAYPDFIMPGSAQPIPEVAVVLDVSGSMAQQYKNAPPGHNIMDQAISELDSILGSFGQMGVSVYASDTAVAWAGRVFNLSQVAITDLAGGTDLTVGIDAAFKGCPRPHIIIILTDGWTDWPQKNKYQDTKIIAGIIGVTREQYEASGTKLPKFIEAIYIDG